MAAQNLQSISPLSMIAGGTIGQNRLVKLDTTAGQVVVCSAITDVAIGVSLESAVATESVPIQTHGKAKVVASAAVSLGAQLMPTASGSGKCATAAGATSLGIGIALTACSNDAELIEVLLAVPNVNGPVNT